mgnify:CR=1 FL=1
MDVVAIAQSVLSVLIQLFVHHQVAQEMELLTTVSQPWVEIS